MIGGLIILVFVSIVCLLAYIIDDGYLKRCARVRKNRIEKRFKNLD